MSAVQTWVGEFQRRAATLPGARAPWLSARRQRAMDRFAEQGWPHSKQENWHHTSLALLAQQTFEAPQARADAKALLDALRQAEDGHWLVFVDGRHEPGLSQVGALPEGARIDTLAALLDAGYDDIQEFFGADDDGASTQALNLALAADGAVIRLAQGVALEAPVHLVFIASAKGASFPRNLIIAEENSQATIVEHYLGAEGAVTFTNAVTRSHLGTGAHITHAKLQEEGEQAFHLQAIETIQTKDSVFNSHALSFGARLARTDIGTRFNGDGCETLFNGLYYANGRRHVDHHTRIDHAKPHGTSREYYRGILDGSARGVFAGRIYVALGADRTDALQRSDNLLLSRLAEADTRPELEIYAEDVKCAHGATVGQINEDSLFYLRTRGYDVAHARNLLTYAFAAEALARIPLDSLRRRAALAIRARLPGGELLEELA
ncbi:MAG: Fe-S cluster assembly protein SufD [Paralcaligenes sp.]